MYDYQSPNESKSQIGTQALVNGKFTTGVFKHEFAAGVSSSQRKDYFGDYVYAWAGVSNIFKPVVVVPDPSNKPGPVLLRRTDNERSIFLQDAIGLTDSLTLHAGLRELHIQRTQQTDNAQFKHSYLLPSIALALKPAANITTYLAFTQGLEHGGLAPFDPNKSEQIFLNPSKSKQFELGVKADLARDLSLSAAVFHINKALEYIDGNGNFISNGEAIHKGLELSAQGKVSQELNIGVSVTALNARQQNTGDVTLDGKRVTNLPKLKSTVYAEYAVQQLKGFFVNANWQYAGSKAFSPDNTVTVPGYHVLNFGARYATQIAGTATTYRFNVDNARNSFYWRDVTQSLGGYLFPGAPRTYKVSAQFDF